MERTLPLPIVLQQILYRQTNRISILNEQTATARTKDQRENLTSKGEHKPGPE